MLFRSARARDELGGEALVFVGAGRPAGASPNPCTLLAHDPRAEEMVLGAALYRFGGASLQECRTYVENLSGAGRQGLAELLLAGLGEHDVPPRELEYANYTFELIMDQGAYAEFKRHRMMTQTPQKLTRTITTIGDDDL